MNTLHIDQFDAVAFDLEGTLIDTVPTHHATRRQAFAQYGFGHITEAQHALGPTYGSTSPEILGGILHAADEIDDVVPFSENPLVTNLIATKLALFRTAARQGFEPMPGAVEFVNLIAPRMAGNVALVTASEEEFVRPSLDRSNLRRHFREELIIGEETVLGSGLKPKPSPDPYLLAARRMDADNMLAFEDTVPGVASAKKAGAYVIAVAFDPANTRQFRNGNLAFPPDTIVDSYDEAASLLGLAA